MTPRFHQRGEGIARDIPVASDGFQNRRLPSIWQAYDSNTATTRMSSCNVTISPGSPLVVTRGDISSQRR